MDRETILIFRALTLQTTTLEIIMAPGEILTRVEPDMSRIMAIEIFKEIPFIVKITDTIGILQIIGTIEIMVLMVMPPGNQRLLQITTYPQGRITMTGK